EEFIDWKAKEEHKVSSMVVGSKVIRKHIENIKQAIKNYEPDEEVYSPNDKYDLNKNYALKRALLNALKDDLPENYLYQILFELRNIEEIPEFPQYSVEWEGDAYNTVSGQTSNNSIRVTDKFMNAVRKNTKWELKERTTGNVIKEINAKDLWNKIILSAWKCADPGLQFHDTTNKWHTCPLGGEINASNPCSEFVFLDSTACNLASINLTALYHDGAFDLKQYVHAIKIWTTILEITVAMSQFPSKEIALKSYEYRPIGLGFAGLGSLLMKMGVPYDSYMGRTFASAVSSLLTSEAYIQSAEIAKINKPFKRFGENKKAMLNIITRHALEHENLSNDYFSQFIDPQFLKQYDIIINTQDEENHHKHHSLFIKKILDHLIAQAQNSWREAYDLGKKYGFRNAQVTCIAPTGTIGLLMDCDTTGIEPDFSLIKYKKLAGGGIFKITNLSIPESLKKLGYKEDEIKEIEEYISENMTIEGAPHVKKEHLPIFDTATPQGRSGRCIPWKAHIEMMKAVQPFISGAISKTINMPSNCTLKDISEAYMLSWELGLKSITIYLDQSKLSQPLSSSINPTNDPLFNAIIETKNYLKDLKAETAYTLPDTKKPDKTNQNKTLSEVMNMIHKQLESEYNNRGVRKPLPSRRKGYIQKAKIAGHSLFLHTGEYKDGKLGEIFIDMHREGAAFRSLLNSFAIAVSLGLQYGVPLEEYIDAFVFSKFEPNGIVQGHTYIKMVTSVIDYIFRDLAITYLGRSDLGQIKPEDLNITETDVALSGKDKNSDFDTSKGDEQMILGEPDNIESPEIVSLIEQARTRGYEGDPCPTCGAFTLIRNGTCMKCNTCGNTTGCS
ncbi:MAG: adenosylcobalamin-dependent ribonucleoside-diphosphate reductase, partial [Prevotella sp.]|nr:adenosylcobalamin-dependent ribonucleoside-diphosphate reductase [Prevotella sp.]